MERNELDEDGYILILNMNFIDGHPKEIDTVKDNAKKNSLFTEAVQLQYGVLKLVDGNLVVSDSVFKEIATSNETDGEWARSARLFMAVSAFTSDNIANIQSLQSMAQGDSSELEGERVLYDTLVRILNREDPRTLMTKFDIVAKLLPDQFVVDFLRAQMEIVAGSPSKAVEFYKGINNPIYRMWPLIVVAHSKALQLNNEVQSALERLAYFHSQRQLVTLPTALLQRDLLIDLEELDKAQVVQGLIEESFPDNQEIALEGALLEIRAGNLQDGLMRLEEMVKNNPEQNRYKLELSKALIDSGNFEKAYTVLEGVPLTEPVYELRSRALIQLQRNDEADVLLQEAISKTSSESLYNIYSDFLIRAGRDTEAKEFLEKCTLKFPDSGWPLISLAFYELKDNNVGSAQTLAENAKNRGVSSAQVSTILAEIYMRRGKFVDAHDEAEAMLAAVPNSKAGAVIKGMSLMGMKKYAEALNSLEESEKKYPKDIQIKLAVIECYTMMKGFAKADRLSEKLYNANSGIAAVIMSRITVLKEYEKIDKALELLDKHAEQIASNDFIAQKSQLMIKQGKVEDALALLSAHKDSEPLKALWLYNEFLYGDFERAVKTVSKIHLAPRDWAQLATEFEKREDFKKAAYFYKQALKENSKHPVLLNNYAWCAWKSTGTVTEDILESSRKASTLLADNVEIMDTYAQLLLSSRNYDKCIDELRVLVSSSYPDARFLYWSAKAYEMKGQRSLALDYYKNALKNQMGKSEWKLELSEAELMKKIEQLSQ